jgi:hypothetical protein
VRFPLPHADHPSRGVVKVPEGEPRRDGSKREATKHVSRARRWNPEQRKLLEDRKKLAWAAQHAYFERASILAALNYLIGIPVVLITALAASEIVLSRAVNEPVPVWVGLITVSATVLASLQTFFRFGERAAFSAQAGHRYSLLRRRIEDAIARPPPDLDDEFEELRKETNKVGEQSPPIGERRWLTWETYARKEQVPPRRRWWRALLGVPEYESRKVRRSTADRKKTGSDAAGQPERVDRWPTPGVKRS